MSKVLHMFIGNSVFFFLGMLTSLQMIEHNFSFAGFEVLTVVTVESTAFWDGMLCSLVEVHEHFRGSAVVL
jgi:hypothetical protein